MTDILQDLKDYLASGPDQDMGEGSADALIDILERSIKEIEELRQDAEAYRHMVDSGNYYA